MISMRISMMAIIAGIGALAINASCWAAAPEGTKERGTDIRTIITEDENTRSIVVGVNKPTLQQSNQNQTVIVAPDYNCYAPYKKTPHHYQHQEHRHALPADK